MDQERDEVYERIPWETLEQQGKDRNWLVMALAGAVVVGALAFSFMRSQPHPPATVGTVATTLTAVPTTGVAAIPVAPTQTTEVNVTEADLFAIDPERLVDQVMAHAEWFAVEYFTVDGSDPERGALRSMLPAEVPLPQSPEGVQVFVDWVGSTTVTELAPLTYQVDVVVRSLVSNADGGFVRQPVRVATVEVVLGEDGLPRITRPPVVSSEVALAETAMTLTPLPEEMRVEVEATHGPVLGGEQGPDGRWRVVAMVTDVDGVTRPRTLVLP